MMHEMSGFERVFAFTFCQHWKSKKFFRATLIVAVLCFLIPALIMTLVEALGEDASSETYENFAVPQTVFVADETSSQSSNIEILRHASQETAFAAVAYRSVYGGLSAAAGAVANSDAALILYMTEEGDTYHARVLIPDETALSSSDAAVFTAFINAALPKMMAAGMGIDSAVVDQLDMPVLSLPHVGGVVETEIDDEYAPETLSPEEEIRELLAMILPYLNIMILYFMVLFYGQGVANSVILEKTSKLVDTFLVTVRPGALIMGKLLAIAASGVLQLMIWLASLVGGFAVGGLLVRAIEPNSQMGLLLFMDQLKLWSGAFSVPAIVISVLMLCGGFLMYCALAAIGGAMASKPEELSSTNALFSMVLIISFLCTLYAGGMDAGMSSTQGWLNWVPFTAIFVVPARVMVGEVSVLAASVSLLLVLAVSFLLTYAAGRIYRMFILYKGNTPKLGDVLKLLLGRA